MSVSSFITQPDPANAGFPVFNRADAAASDFNALNAVISRMLSGRRTVMPVQVCAVSGAGLAPVGFVDVQPLVQQQDATGRVTPHGVLYNVPYFRLQGGARAVILDPAVGDIGLALVADRDIFNVKTARASAAPGSFRQQNMADALYIGGFLNSAPQEYLWFSDSGITMKTAGTVSIEAQSMRISGAVSVEGSLSVTQDATASGISLTQHIHPGVSPGSASTGTPQG
ncbi:baseplate assembly protein [Acetobacter farinalis]|uniref:Baseplate assembly protein n=1 Tax=Acetobacter farinalis TaxID=1260984 RepID=A0ABT3QA26_9PROT|nr:Gp138 family membrane-puncturing spike protein [Acetobacter farinalis]MCX2562145.1 baseplate assembly protein [Acetobacter farinalis]NHO30698.1 baseplate assembly protein [Acetobacter farinalis]